jgi:hypothetical protein
MPSTMPSNSAFSGPGSSSSSSGDYASKMISLAAARGTIGSDLTPDAIASFVDGVPAPLSALLERRADLAAVRQGPIISELAPGEVRPYINVRFDVHVERALDALWGTLLYSHQAAVPDPLTMRRYDKLDASRERGEALKALHLLSIIAPLIDSGVVVLVSDDLLPAVTLDIGNLQDRIGGFVAALIEGTDSHDSEFHPASMLRQYVSQLEWLASTGWSVHIRPLFSDASQAREAYVVRRLVRVGRRHLWSHHLRRAVLNEFDSFALGTLTHVPVPDLTDLTPRDIQVIRDEDAFGAWRAELSGIIGEYQRNLTGPTRAAAAIATERLAMRAADIEQVVQRSDSLLALRSGLSTLGISGSAVLAAFPILSVAGRTDGLALAAGASLVRTGRRLLFHERTRCELPLQHSKARHFRAAAAIFRAR